MCLKQTSQTVLAVMFLFILFGAPALAGGYVEDLDSERSRSDSSKTKPVFRVIPVRFDWSSWKKTQLEDGTICQSRSVNTICLSAEQAEAMGW
jgi:hypothetical protein